VKTRANNSAFTLIELLVVIAIIGILAALAAPTLTNFRAGDALAASTRQLLDDVARARQFAISQRTTVYMVFCPADFWNQTGYGAFYASLTAAEQKKIAKLYDKQLTGYTFVSLKSIGDQPGQQSPRYLSRWKVMPEGAIIAPWKFVLPRANYQRITDPPTGALPTDPYYDVYGFSVTNNIPFPSEDSYLPGKTYIWLPYIAFNHLGMVERPSTDRGSEFIPIARGSVSFARSNGVPIQSAATATESPANNSINAFSLIEIDALTGRAKLVKQEVK
jgi:prepilin-type N-terminal cleavage/methylation domain-containing protein